MEVKDLGNISSCSAGTVLVMALQSKGLIGIWSVSHSKIIFILFSKECLKC